VAVPPGFRLFLHIINRACLAREQSCVLRLPM